LKLTSKRGTTFEEDKNNVQGEDDIVLKEEVPLNKV